MTRWRQGGPAPLSRQARPGPRGGLGAYAAPPSEIVTRGGIIKLELTRPLSPRPCATFTASPRARPRSATGFARGVAAPAICHCFQAFSPTRWRRSSVSAPRANASWSWRAGACQGRLNMAASQSRTSATSRARTGVDGLDRSIVASCPATSFCEYEDTKPRKTPIWFALADDRPLFAFAGLWTPWRGARGPKSAPVVGQHELFGFLTTEANAIGNRQIHPKAIQVPS